MQVIIVTGLSGAGKTQAMNSLEDQGYYCVDNMPPALIVSFMNLTATSKDRVDKVAFAVDIRGGEFFAGFMDALDALKETDADVKMIFLEASSQVLYRRFSETRRVHPGTRKPVRMKDIEEERQRLADLREQADYVIDTSNMKSAQLKQELLDLLSDGEGEQSFVINIMSFGFKNGIPISAEMVFDMRFLPNPFYVQSLKKLTGNNKKVQDYVLKFPQTRDFIGELLHLLDAVIPCYMKEGKWNLNLAFGCTGGHHRSVVMANEFYRRLEKRGWQVTLEHRDIKK